MRDVTEGWGEVGWTTESVEITYENPDVDPMEKELRQAAIDSLHLAVMYGWAAIGDEDPLPLLLPDEIPLTRDVIWAVQRITKVRPLVGMPRPAVLGGGFFPPQPVHARVALRRWVARQEAL